MVALREELVECFRERIQIQSSLIELQSQNVHNTAEITKRWVTPHCHRVLCDTKVQGRGLRSRHLCANAVPFCCLPGNWRLRGVKTAFAMVDACCRCCQLWTRPC